MFKKKLLTVACALGILACGACFLPPLPAPTPRATAPPAPVLPRWIAIHTVRVVATDVSDKRHLDGDGLAMKVANRINWLTGGTVIRAYASDQPGSEDAVLEVKVEKESETRSATSPKRDDWTFAIGISATMTDRYGQVRWQDAEPAILYYGIFPHDPSLDEWNERGLKESLPDFLGERVAHRVLYEP